TGTAVQIAGGVFRQATVGADGRFSFATLPAGTYTLSAFDGQGRLRAQATGIALASHAVVTRDLALIGLGTVTGVVRNPASQGGTPAGNVAVSVRTSSGLVGTFFSGTSDPTTGVYAIAGVPVGSFVASASVPQQQLLGETPGQIAADGQTVTADIQLQDN